MLGERAGSVLFVEDDADARDLVCQGLEHHGFHVVTAESAERALECLDEEAFDAVVTDVCLGEMDGIDLCERIASIDERLPVIIATGLRETDTALAAMRVHADDFVTKPFDLAQLASVVARAVRDRRLYREVAGLTEAAGDMLERPLLLSHDPQIQRIVEIIQQIAEFSTTVLVTGESGTGKELVARALHDASSRPGAFVAVNCAALPAGLLESELFGHVKGAFTDALGDRAGLFVRASRGTLFLDEIGDMPLDMQVKLLRVTQEHQVRPIGSNHAVDVDARIIAATKHDLEQAVAAGEFRADLYYRLNIIPLSMPPLRARRDDILPLAQRFLEHSAVRLGKEVTQISLPAAAMLVDYQWPGNVRELENTMARAVTLTLYSAILPEDLPDHIRAGSRDAAVAQLAADEPLPTLAEIERRHLIRVLRAVDGNRTKAARVLGLNRRSLYRRMQRLDIDSEILIA